MVGSTQGRPALDHVAVGGKVNGGGLGVLEGQGQQPKGSPRRKRVGGGNISEEERGGPALGSFFPLFLPLFICLCRLSPSSVLCPLSSTSFLSLGGYWEKETGEPTPLALASRCGSVGPLFRPGECTTTTDP